MKEQVPLHLNDKLRRGAGKIILRNFQALIAGKKARQQYKKMKQQAKKLDPRKQPVSSSPNQ